ncbi:MAG: hypothetical protein QMD00_03020 [Hadesarchaea archaeon]|nr:hypothetical protein [Hadesarchaea archaeon]
MDRSGQVFTLDMFFALTLTVLVVSYSGLALEQARRQAEGYALRYSLERTANDAADVLVRTAGDPPDWWQNIENLETLGLVENTSGGVPVYNNLSMRKFENLRQLCASGNWTAYPDAAQAVRALFDNSENFEILLINENTGEYLWPPIYPRWDVRITSGVENSLEVVVVKRLITTGVETENEIENIVHIAQPERYKMYFTVGSNELNTRDWYVVLNRHLAPPPVQPEVRVWVNRDIPDSGDWDFKSPPDDSPFRIRWHGTDYPDGSDFGAPVALHEGSNFIWVRVSGKWAPVDIAIVALPRCSPSQFVALPPIGTLEVKLWR